MSCGTLHHGGCSESKNSTVEETGGSTMNRPNVINRIAERLLQRGANKLSQKYNVRIRNRFLRDYQKASDATRHKYNAEIYNVLLALAKYNDADAIREIYCIGYPGCWDADDLWVDPSLAGVAAENSNYEALQALADNGIDVSWYGGFLNQFNWMYVIERNDIRMCRIIATAKERIITEEAAAFILEHCYDLVPELVKQATSREWQMWNRVINAIGQKEAIALLKDSNKWEDVSLRVCVETLVSVLHYENALMLVQQQPHLVDATSLWPCIFPGSTPDCYTHNFFYSDEMNEARSKLIDFLFSINLLPDHAVVHGIIESAKKWRYRNERSYNNYLRTVVSLLDRGVSSYAQAIQDAIWFPPQLSLTHHLVSKAPSGTSASGLGYVLVDSSLSGYWPKVIAHPLGRFVRFDLWRRFCNEHDAYVNDVIDILKQAHSCGVLDINEQNTNRGETALHVLCKGAFPQALKMPCVQELLVALIAVGADVSIRDKHNKTAYDYAAEKHAPKAFLRLLATGHQ